MKKQNIKIYNFSILIAFILSIFGGIFFPTIMSNLSFIGTIYINLLKFMIMPILFVTITLTIYESKQLKGKLILKTVFVFLIMFIATFLITSLIVFLIKPGNNFKYDIVKWGGEITNLNFSEILINMFPSNLATMILNNSIFAIILFSIVFGIAASNTTDSKILINSFYGLKSVLYKILEYIMWLTPIGVLSLLGTAIVSYKFTIFEMGIRYILVAYLCSFIILVFIMILPVYVFLKISPIEYIKKIYKTWIISATTCSSVATLPTTIKICNEELNIPRKTTNIVVPLGCTIHMCGGAVSFALLAIFCSQLFQIPITFQSYILMIISANLINMAAPGIPNGGIVIGATYLSILGIPTTFIGFYSSIYKVLDMSYTTLNVTGDITASLLVNNISKKE